MDFIYLIEDLLKNDNGQLNIFGKSLVIIIVFLAVKILTNIVNAIINRALERRKKSIFAIDEKKFDTLAHVLKSVIKFILYFIGIMIALDTIGIDTKSILATAGIGGLAISFGAQSLVKDIITGFFIIIEDQFSVGDYVTIGEHTGTVEELGIRVTKLRDFSGELHIIPNGNINVVTNKSRGPMTSTVDISIAYEEDIDRAVKVIQQVCSKIKEADESILEGPSVLGVTDLGDSGVSIRVTAKTKPMNQWSLERKLRKSIKEAFDKENIEIPYPKMIIYNGKP